MSEMCTYVAVELQVPQHPVDPALRKAAQLIPAQDVPALAPEPPGQQMLRPSPQTPSSSCPWLSFHLALLLPPPGEGKKPTLRNSKAWVSPRTVPRWNLQLAPLEMQDLYGCCGLKPIY